MAPILLCDTTGMDREQWLSCRMHGPKGNIPITVGGSDISTIFGVNPWKTPLELWMEKRELSMLKEDENLDQKEMGHLMEPVVAHWYGKQTGYTIIPDNSLYQHPKYEFALANLDYRFMEPSGSLGVLDCKSTSYRKAYLWDDGQVPVYYEMQIRFYLAVMDYAVGDLACLWGMNPNTDMATARITRDEAMEGLIFDKVCQFVKSVQDNDPPSMRDVADPELAMKALARIYAQSQKGLPTVTFGKAFEKPLRRMAVLQTEIETLSAQINKNKKEVQAHTARVADVMKDHEYGILETPGEIFRVQYATKVTKRVDADKLKHDYSTIYQDVLKESKSRPMKVSIETTAAAAAI